MSFETLVSGKNPEKSSWIFFSIKKLNFSAWNEILISLNFGMGV
jgi:hypothetical protein